MEWIKEYILCVTSAAILCSIVKLLVGSKGTISAIVKLLTGLFLAVTVVSPWTDLNISDWENAMDDFAADADHVIQSGQSQSMDSIRELIKENTESYIRDKAAYLEMDIIVSVTVSEEEIPVPICVRIQTSASPFAKKVLSQYITDTLGITEDKQIWT